MSSSRLNFCLKRQLVQWGTQSKCSSVLAQLNRLNLRVDSPRVECSFSEVLKLSYKHHNRLDIVQKGDFRLTLTNIKPDVLKLARRNQAQGSHYNNNKSGIYHCDGCNLRLIDFKHVILTDSLNRKMNNDQMNNNQKSEGSNPRYEDVVYSFVLPKKIRHPSLASTLTSSTRKIALIKEYHYRYDLQTEKLELIKMTERSCTYCPSTGRIYPIADHNAYAETEICKLCHNKGSLQKDDEIYFE